MAETPHVTRRVRYAGRVQGVGFRHTAVRLATPLAVVGTVRNRDDGRVELIAQGPESEVARLLAAIRDHWGDALADEVIDDHPRIDETGFRIAH